MAGNEGEAHEPQEMVRIPVWDWPVRAFHWSIVVLVVVSVVTAKVGGNAMEWHVRSGVTILALVLFRIAWGFAGNRHARFSGFVASPRRVIAYAGSLARGEKSWHVGHNPLGSWSIVALLLVLLFQAGTGLFSNDDIATDGPLVKLISKDLSDTITSLHDRNAWILFALVGVHVAAALYYQFGLKQNLIGPMITGDKAVPRHQAHAAAEGAATAKAFVLLALCAFVVWWVVKKL
jgi:cytochrome b